MVKKQLQYIASILGFEVVRKKRIESRVGFTPDYLKKVCDASTVIDVGVGHGTIPLHKAFPDAKFILIEPLKEYEDSINALAKQYDCDVHYKAAGEQDTALEINIDTTDLQKSSFLKRSVMTETGNVLRRC